MKKRRERFDNLPSGTGDIEYFGLRRGQFVTIRNRGQGIVAGEPPQGPGVYVTLLDGRQHLVTGEDILEATEPS